MSSQRPFIISVAGAHSKVGKTTLCTLLLGEFKGFGAIKYTKTSLYTALIDDRDILDTSEKDTSLFLRSGSRRVFWIKSPYRDLQNALSMATGRMESLQGFVVEGNSPVDFLNADLILFVIGDTGEIKPSARSVYQRADMVVVNSPGHKRPLPFLSDTAREGRKVFWIDLKAKKGEIHELLSSVKERYTGRPHQGKDRSEHNNLP